MRLKKYLFIIIAAMFSFSLFAQSPADVNLLLSHSNDSILPLKRKLTFGVVESKNVIVRYNPLSLAAGSLMFFYQAVFSPQLSATCGFHPSCSEAGKGLVKTHGLIKGTFCTADRLMRCNKVAFINVQPDEFDPIDNTVHEGPEYYE